METVKLLLKYGVGDQRSQPLDPEGVSRADVHAENDEALIGAAGNGHTEMVKLLLENEADVHALNDCALRCAAANGHTQTVKKLLEYGASSHVSGGNYRSALWTATQNNHIETVRVLLEGGGPNKSGITRSHTMSSYLYQCIRLSENIEIFRIWLEYLKYKYPKVFSETILRYGSKLIKYMYEECNCTLEEDVNAILEMLQIEK